MPRLLLRHTWADVAVVDLQGRSGLPARRALVTAEFVAAAAIGLGVSALTVAHADGWSQVLMAVLIAGVGVNYLILATHAFRFWSRLAQGLETPRGISTAVRRETGQQSLWLIIPFVVLLPSSMSQTPGSRQPATESWDEPSAPDREPPGALGPLTTVTLLNFGWQIPYGLHQYGWRSTTFPRLSSFLVLAFIWFLSGLLFYRRSGGHKRWLLASFLMVEVAFYAVHYVSGAFLSDLHWDNPTVLIASLLGYLSALVAAVWYLLRIFCDVRLGAERRNRTAKPTKGEN